MKTSLLLKTVAGRNPVKILMSTHTGSVERVINKNLEYYRNLDAIDTSKLEPADWEGAKPFESIPGPKPLPIVGNTWRFFLPKVGDFYGMDLVQIHKKMNQQFGDISIMNGLIGLEPLVVLFNPQDIEKLHRNEGVWPYRDGLQSFTHYRNSRKNLLPSVGLMALQGEEWFKFRSIVNQILMQPKNVVQYTDKMNTVADELVDNIRYFSEQNKDGQMPDDFQNELYKWALESVAVVATDTHLGCLKRDGKNLESQKMIHSVLRMFELMFKLDVLPSLWKYVTTRNWREYVKILDFMVETNLKHINKYLAKMEKGEVEVDQKEVSSMLYQMIKVDRNVAIAMSVDMMMAGIDTTGRTLSAALYYLAKNPVQQEKLKEEAYALLDHKHAPVTKEILSRASFLKAAIKETTRLSPIAIGNFRKTKKHMVLGGYQIPKDTNVLTSTLLLSQQDRHFARAKEFLPERWLKGTGEELSRKDVNPFVFAPFGFGPRSCIGKRLANLELETAILKIVRNFELTWPHEDMVFSTTTLHGIAGPLKIRVKPRDS